ncbi:hypothetical protein B566_EDAN006313 [Ephemera danica]|nr:hypothetical protein B566_EDAN006313 [Ephemera danica]
MGNILRSASLFHKLGFNLVTRNLGAEPLINMTAREFMFGYRDPLVRLGNRFLKSWIYFDKLGLIDRFANRIGPNDTVTIYRKPICRPMTLERVSEETVEGMRAYRYKFMRDAMDNGQLNPEYKCYCQGVSRSHCPTPTSSMATQVYWSMWTDVGLPLEVAVRTQINIALKTMPGIARVSKFQDTVLPLLWSETRMYSLPRSMLNRFVLYFNVLPVLQQACVYCLLSIGVATLLAGVLGVLCRPKEPARYRSLLTLSSSGTSLPQAV